MLPFWPYCDAKRPVQSPPAFPQRFEQLSVMRSPVLSSQMAFPWVLPTIIEFWRKICRRPRVPIPRPPPVEALLEKIVH